MYAAVVHQINLDDVVAVCLEYLRHRIAEQIVAYVPEVQGLVGVGRRVLDHYRTARGVGVAERCVGRNLAETVDPEGGRETQVKEGLYAKEMIARKLKNRKIEMDESIMAHMIKKLGFKETSDFYKQLTDEKLDINNVIETYIDVRNHDLNLNGPGVIRSAEEFSYENHNDDRDHTHEDVLVIDRDLMGIDYTLAKCCHPIYGDPIFGFVTINGGIKIHCTNCPNAPELRKRFGYRIVKARWSGKGSSQYNITLRIIGNDDIGIVNNITSVISKEEKIVMRSINIDSNDGLFRGNIVIQIDDTSRLESLLRKLRTIKGVKSAVRL